MAANQNFDSFGILFWSLVGAKGFLKSRGVFGTSTPKNIIYTCIKAFVLLWQAQQRPVAAVIITNFIAKNKIKVNIEMSSIRMRRIGTNSIGMNQINGHLVNLQVDSFSSVKALSDVTRFVINDRHKIDVLTQKAVSDNVFRLFFVICEPKINYES